MIHIYGIKNCNTVKKALTFLTDNQIEFTFHDFKKEGASEDQLSQWGKLVGWEKLINKKGTTWKKIDPAVQQTIDHAEAAYALLSEHTSMIKRPVLEYQNSILLGFDEEAYNQLKS